MELEQEEREQGDALKPTNPKQIALDIVLACEKFIGTLKNREDEAAARRILIMFSAFIVAVVGEEVSITDTDCEGAAEEIAMNVVGALRAERERNNVLISAIPGEEKLKTTIMQLQALNMKLAADKYALLAEKQELQRRLKDKAVKEMTSISRPLSVSTLASKPATPLPSINQTRISVPFDLDSLPDIDLSDSDFHRPGRQDKATKLIRPRPPSVMAINAHPSRSLGTRDRRSGHGKSEGRSFK